MNKRVRLFEFTELLQCTILKKISEKEKDAIVVTVYGYTRLRDHIEFSYEIEFNNEEDRDLTFMEITSDLMFEDIKKIISSSNIPILI
ncbi:hypothetical protein [Flavobacterium covae]|uniref:hypothetical protein n=1 Tax=Flavobacterium covae TaxID=2906076 RepID=UPI000745C91D|nr:hypothetical protein [Flavobacterium covae]AMA48964.1 hypothetical protein AWN65_05550 [Flavobacterium covae]MCJ1809882.1 hypothetical protein [Flavobacterium covae]